MRGWGLFSICLAICVGAFVGCHSNRPIGSAGSERGPCHPDGTCDAGLSCFSNRCVRYIADASDGVMSQDGGGYGGISGSGGAAGTGGGAGRGAGGGPPGNGGSAGRSAGGSPGTGGSPSGAGGSSSDAGPDAAVDARVDAAVDARAPYCDGGVVGATESIVAAACGYTPATTSASYSDFVALTVSGLFDNSPDNPLEDPFYLVNRSAPDQAVAACPDCFRYNRVSEATCVCSFECAAASHPISDLLVGDYPAFRLDHQYSVLLDLGSAPAERLNFGMADCGCNDNSGSHTVALTRLARGTCDD